MSSGLAKLQRAALALRPLPLVPVLYRGYYSLGQSVFVFFARRIGRHKVKSIYLRRGGGRAELVPAASDLDFFLVLETLSAEHEMEFLKTFWARYQRLRLLFPFLGEVLMGDKNELINWLSTATVRAFETQYSWKLLWGKKSLTEPTPPDLRDLFSESLKNYSDLLQVVLKLQPEQFTGARPYTAGAVHLRNSAKAALDIFRLHAIAKGAEEKIWKASRLELIQILPQGKYTENLEWLRPLLELKGHLFTVQDPYPLFVSLVHAALNCLDEMASSLSSRSERYLEGEYQVDYSSAAATDHYSLSVRELFAERTILRHSVVQRAILSEATCGIYFTLNSLPELSQLFALLLDLRDVSFSFDRLSVAMPLTELIFSELEKTSLLDTPFHSFAGHRQISLENGVSKTSAYSMPAVRIPESMLRKTFAELNFGLRLQPKELAHFLEKIVAVVLGLRLAAGHREISTNFYKTLSRYGERYPLRQEQLKAKIYPYLNLESEAENKVWAGVLTRLEEFKSEAPVPASQLISELEQIRRKNQQLSLSKSATSDLWINLTPFLRMEMNAMKEKYFEQRPALKI